MLLHTTLYTYTHGQLQSLIKGYLDRLESEWRISKPELANRLKSLWAEEQGRVTPKDLNLELDLKSFEQLRPHVSEVFARCKVIVDNGQRATGLDYAADDPSVYVAIGGNTLSRGVTLEGLMVSYFIRTASAYDTLLQMGRWFGYRRGYEDLPRVWMTSELQDHFLHLATVEAEIRNDIRRYEREGRTPRDFSVRVQTHPKLAVTSRLKMQNVSLASASYGDTHIQTFRFRHDDVHWLQQNLDATRNLLGAIGGKPRPKSGARWLYEEVEPGLIKAFLRGYQALGDDFTPRLLLDYIESEESAGGLQSWAVGLIGSEKMPELDLGAPVPTRRVRRSRFKQIKPANIKALTSRADRVIDLPWEGSVDNLKIETISALRNEHRPESGLLLIYPIDKDSSPSRPSDERHNLRAAEHIIGIGISFPSPKRPMKEYVHNNLDRVFKGEDLEEDRPEEHDLSAGMDEDYEREG